MGYSLNNDYEVYAIVAKSLSLRFQLKPKVYLNALFRLIRITGYDYINMLERIQALTTASYDACEINNHRNALLRALKSKRLLQIGLPNMSLP